MIKDYLKETPGPMPWYRDELPMMDYFNWTFNEDINAITLQDNIGDNKLIINRYTRVFKLFENYIGIWYEKQMSFSIEAFNVDKLRTITNKDWEMAREGLGPYISSNIPIGKIDINKNYPYVMNNYETPKIFKVIPEIFLIGKNNTAKYPYSIYILNTLENSIQELQQKWFTEEKYDLGYAWITKVNRHIDSNRIIGTGIRVKDFILSEDGCQLDKWA